MKLRYLSDADIEVLDELRLQEGKHSGVVDLLRSWAYLVDELMPEYSDIVDEFTNDVWSREVLNTLVEKAPPMVSERLLQELQPLDEMFIQRTDLIGEPYFHSRWPKSHFWMLRVPKNIVVHYQSGFPGRLANTSGSATTHGVRRILQKVGKAFMHLRKSK